MDSVALLFPGQGAQFVGMGEDLAEAFPAARALFEEADALLGFPLSEFCFQGPQEALIRTGICQPALFVTSLAALRSLVTGHWSLATPTAAAGLSLGEYTALAAAGALTFEEGLRLVRLRGEAMEEAATASPGAMAGILGLPLDRLEALCAETGAEVANLNSPDQVVISGPPEQVKAASELAKAQGAKRVVALEVGGAFHSRLMRPAASRLKQALESVCVRPPRIAVLSNVTGQAHPGGQESGVLLVEQLTKPVRWEACVRTLLSMGIRRFLEVGPGSVLKGLLRRIEPQAQVLSVGTAEQVRQAAETMGGA